MSKKEKDDNLPAQESTQIMPENNFANIPSSIEFTVCNIRGGFLS